jgi:CheY-like chemotaxis protein
MTYNTISVLAVEDEAINQIVLKAFFKSLNLNAKVVTTGNEALAAIQHEHHVYDLVFMDLGLPDMTGLEASQQIRQFEQQNQLDPLYICALTATDDAQKQQECLSVGMNQFMTKPITMERIEQLLQVFHLTAQ